MFLKLKNWLLLFFCNGFVFWSIFFKGVVFGVGFVRFFFVVVFLVVGLVEGYGRYFVSKWLEMFGVSECGVGVLGFLNGVKVNFNEVGI